MIKKRSLRIDQTTLFVRLPYRPIRKHVSEKTDTPCYQFMNQGEIMNRERISSLNYGPSIL